MEKTLSKSFIVSEQMSALMMGSGTLKVLATPSLAACMENAAMDLMSDELNDSQSSVGIELNLKHLAPTAIGSTIEVQVVLKENTEKIYTFDVKAIEGDKLIGTAIHKRAIVTTERFMASFQNK